MIDLFGNVLFLNSVIGRSIMEIHFANIEMTGIFIMQRYILIIKQCLKI